MTNGDSPARNDGRFKLIDLTGRRFGTLTVVSLFGMADSGSMKRAKWNCKCDCGRTVAIFGSNLKHKKSCGCVRRAYPNIGKTKYQYKTREYAAWKAMIRRCTQSTCREYHYYGGRGIRVCERWMTFDNFLADIGARPSDSHSLDRIDNSGNYEPPNCRWANIHQQQRNRRFNRLLTVNGVTKCMSEWCEERGMSWSTLGQRLELGWSHEKAVMTPPRFKRKPHADALLAELARGKE